MLTTFNSRLLTLGVLLSSFLTTATPLVERDGAGSVVTAPKALRWYSSSLTNGTSGRNPPNSYICYSGPAANFPSINTWVNFNTMWSTASVYALKPVNDTDSERSYIHSAILSVSKQAKVDARIILATILLESTGNVRVPCTKSFGGVYNCGIMQSYDATNKTYDPKHSQQSILGMVVDGVQGTAAGPGQVQYFNDANDTAKETGGNAYKVFRSYNSGSVNKYNLSDGLGASDSYVSNMANYLQGWNGTSLFCSASCDSTK